MSKKLFLLSSLTLVLAFNSFAQTTPPNNKETVASSVSRSVDTTEKVSPGDAIKNALKVGDKIPDFSLVDTGGKTISSSELLEQGNLIVAFYNGAWCAECNLYLQKLQKNLSQINSQGANVVAISNEPPIRSQMIAGKNKVKFTILSDPNLLVSRKFGIVYDLPEEVNKSYRENGLDLAAYNQTKTIELPLVATYVVNRDGEIVRAFIGTDDKKRPELSELIESLAKLQKTQNK